LFAAVDARAIVLITAQEAALPDAVGARQLDRRGVARGPKILAIPGTGRRRSQIAVEPAAEIRNPWRSGFPQFAEADPVSLLQPIAWQACCRVGIAAASSTAAGRGGVPRRLST
jgi:hypothetical protein